MKTLLLPLLATLALSPGSAPAELDFTLQHKATSADAIAVDKPFITDGPSKIYLQLLGSWRVLDSADRLEFTPTVADSQVLLGKYRGPELTIDEAGGRKLLQQVVAQLPEGSKNVTPLPAEVDPFPILGWNDLQVAVQYEFYGQKLRRSVMYVHMRPGRLVEFSVTAPDAEFDKLYKPARSILASWFEPSRDLPPKQAQEYEDGGKPR